jgi:hypothetical protein
MRVLGYGDDREKQIKHVYLLHNGLNETSDLLFHYRLAAWIINRRPDAVCILRPLPGHLTRYPFEGPYAAKPLDDYLHDPADLFRQFLRHMLETQWLLSALVPRSQYLIAAGTELLGEAAPQGGEHPIKTGRTEDAHLASAMDKAWQAAFDSNLLPASDGSAQAGKGAPAGEGTAVCESAATGEAAAAGEAGASETDAGEADNPEGADSIQADPSETERAAGGETDTREFSMQVVTKEMIEELVTDLRQLLDWQPALFSDKPRVPPASDAPAELEPPCIHAVGYSMGGFVAQAVFFAWPFAVSSCTNLFAGGALRDLAPTAFAHPEEWQAVLHALRYELDRAFRDGYLSPSPEGLVAGIEQPLFGYFTRIFYEVFLQYYRGGYSSGVAEFSRRLLFVVGGDDPIVRTKNVLDAGPPKGMTLFQIADVSHFPGGRPGGTAESKNVESEQRKHWLPEVGRVLANFSEHSERLLNRTLADSWGVYLGEGGSEPVADIGASVPEVHGEHGPGMLDSATFATEMNSLIKQALPTDEESDTRGWLLIARNEVPPAFLERQAFLIYAQAVHHSEEEITRYIRVLRAHAKWLSDKPDRVSLLIPQESEWWFEKQGERERFFSKSETASAARMPEVKIAKDMWAHFEREWIKKQAVRLVPPFEYEPGALGEIGRSEAKRLNVEMISLTSLPDVWIALSDEAFRSIVGEGYGREKVEKEVIEWAINLSREWTEEALKKARERRSGKSTGSLEEKKKTRLLELKQWMDSGAVRAIEVSGAELNSRYRGRLLLKETDVRRAIIHWALAYQAAAIVEGE